MAGSSRTPSRSVVLAEAAAECLRRSGLAAEVLELACTPLPFFGVGDASPDVVEEMRHRVRRACAIIWVTPVYHGTMSSILKNAIEWIEPSSVRAMPLGLVAQGGGRFGGSVLDHLRSVAIHLVMRPVTCQILAQPSDFALEGGVMRVVSPDIWVRLSRLAYELRELVVEHRPACCCDAPGLRTR